MTFKPSKGCIKKPLFVHNSLLTDAYKASKHFKKTKALSTMKKILLTLAASTAVLTLVFAQADRIVAKVNGIDIKASDLALADEDFGQSAQGIPADQKEALLLESYANLVIAAKAAEAKGLDKTPDFAQKLAYARQKLLVESFLQNEVKGKVKDADIKKFYDEEVAKLKPTEEVKARHILLASEEEAKSVVAKLKAGGNFEALAKELSKDTGSGAEGGDLGYFTKETMVPEFADVAFKSPKGEVSAPVKSQFGWHIIKVEDKRMKEAPKAPALEEVKAQIEEMLTRKIQQDVIADLRKAAKIEKIEAKKPDAPKIEEKKK
jgi:peptidyl-prolyl cis-trans isomerase C